MLRCRERCLEALRHCVDMWYRGIRCGVDRIYRGTTGDQCDRLRWAAVVLEAVRIEPRISMRSKIMGLDQELSAGRIIRDVVILGRDRSNVKAIQTGTVGQNRIL